jgi:heme oxygenase
MKMVNKYSWIKVYEVKRGKRYKKYIKVLTQPNDSREAIHTASIK